MYLEIANVTKTTKPQNIYLATANTTKKTKQQNCTEKKTMLIGTQSNENMYLTILIATKHILQQPMQPRKRDNKNDLAVANVIKNTSHQDM